MPEVPAGMTAAHALRKQVGYLEMLLAMSRQILSHAPDETGIAVQVCAKLVAALGLDLCRCWRARGDQAPSLLFSSGIVKEADKAALRTSFNPSSVAAGLADSWGPVAFADPRSNLKPSEPEATSPTSSSFRHIKGPDGDLLGMLEIGRINGGAFDAQDDLLIETAASLLAEGWERYKKDAGGLHEPMMQGLTGATGISAAVLAPDRRSLLGNETNVMLVGVERRTADRSEAAELPSGRDDLLRLPPDRPIAGQSIPDEGVQADPAGLGIPSHSRANVDPKVGPSGPDGAASIVVTDMTGRPAGDPQVSPQSPQLDFLVRASQRLVLLRHLDEDALAAVFGDIAEHLDVGMFYHYRPGKRPRTLELRSSGGTTQADRETFACIAYGEQLCGRVAESCERLIVEDLQHSDQPGSELLAASGATLYAGFPLTTDGKLIGTIAFIDSKRRMLRPGDVQMVQTICEQIAIVLERTASNARFRTLANSIPALMFVTDAQGANTFVNEPFLSFTGLQTDELMGCGWLSVVHPDDRQRAGERWQESLSTGATYSIEYRFRRCDGEYRWHLVRAHPVHDDHGEVLQWVGTAIDLHELVQIRQELAAQREVIVRVNTDLERRVRERTAELEQANVRLIQEIERRELAQAQLVQAQKLEALGQLTSGVAHDFNNVIAALAGGFSIIERRTDDPRLLEISRHGKNAAMRGAQMVKQLLAFARQQVLEQRAVDLAELLAETEPLLVRSVGQGISIKVDPVTVMPPVRVDPVQLEAALINLAVNSRDAMPNGGTIRLSVRFCGAGERGRPHELGDSDAVAISIADEGEGIPPHLLGRILDPFFTTKATGKGTGLGLAMVHGFAMQSNGALRVTSTVGEGTTVTIFLQVAGPQDVATQGSAEAEGAAAPRGGGELILLVDDDEAVRGITAAQLLELGYVVRQAGNSDEALSALSNDRFAMLLTDVVMPGTDGVTLAKQVRRACPDMSVLFMTGHADRHRLEGEAILDKPFSSDALARAVHAGLASRERRDAPRGAAAE